MSTQTKLKTYQQLLLVIGLLFILSVGLLWGLKNINEPSTSQSPQPVQNTGQTQLVTEQLPHRVSLQALAAKQYDGRDLTVGPVLAQNETYKRHYITYKSGQLKISGIMNVPSGAGPFPVLILNHGHIDPAIYTNGRGLKREQDYLAREGYVVIHPDYRGHADSDDSPDDFLNLRLGYTEDVINAVYAVRESELPYFDKDNIGMLGHSMGGGITTNIITALPDLIKAAVLFAPVSADYQDNFNKWTRSRADQAERITAAYGTPTSSPEFWYNVSPINFINQITVPIMLHHGTADESCPIEWSNRYAAALEAAGKNITYHTYPGEPHEFINAWPTVMRRTTEFFDQYLKERLQ